MTSVALIIGDSADQYSINKLVSVWGVNWRAAAWHLHCPGLSQFWARSVTTGLTITWLRAPDWGPAGEYCISWDELICSDSYMSMSVYFYTVMSISLLILVYLISFSTSVGLTCSLRGHWPLIITFFCKYQGYSSNHQNAICESSTWANML